MSCDFRGEPPADSHDTHTRQPTAEPARAGGESGSSTLASPEKHETVPPQLGDDCLILAGPTAAGKSAIAIPLAQRLGAEIVSVDSMAVYRGLDIGTAKPSAAEQRRVPHHAIDLVAANEPFSVAAWLTAVGRAMESIRSRGRKVLFVGGTPLYLKTLREGLTQRPAADPAVRETLARRVEREGAAALHRELGVLDPAAAARIHPNDARRIVRAIEVATLSPPSAASPAAPTWNTAQGPSPAAPLLVLDVPRRLLAERIATRVQRMFAEGLVEEVQVAEASVGLGPTARQAAGYSEVLAMLAGDITRDQAIEQTIRRTRQLAKRQRTWFRSFQDAVWICG